MARTLALLSIVLVLGETLRRGRHSRLSAPVWCSWRPAAGWSSFNSGPAQGR
jgi:hypothetical protein